MSSIVIRELLTVYGYDVDDKAIKKGDKALAQLKRTSMAVAGIITGAAASMLGLTRNVANAGDAAAKQGKALGMTAEEIQEINYAAELSGTSISELDGGIKRFQRTVVDAAEGNESYKKTLAEMGLQTQDENGNFRGTADLMTEAIEALAGYEDMTLRGARAQELFGRSGGKVLQFIENGESGLRALRQEARDYGVVISNEAASAGEQFNDTIVRLTAVAKGIKNELGSQLLLEVLPIAKAFLEWAKASKELVRTRVAQAIKGITTALKFTWAGFRAIVDITQRVIDAFGGLRRVLAIVQFAMMALVSHMVISNMLAMVRVVWGWVASLRAVGVAATLANAKAMLLPIAIAILGALIWAVWEDFQNFYEGNDSAIGELLERYPNLGAAILAIGEAIGAIWTLFSDFFEFLFTGHSDWDNGVTRAGEAMGDAVYDGVQAAKAWLSEFWTWITAGFDTAIQGVVDAFWRIVDAVMSVGKKAKEELESIPGLGLLIKGNIAVAGAALDLGRGAAQGAGRLLQTARGGGGANTQVDGDTINLNLQQRPGESQEEFAERIEKVLKRREERKRRAISRAADPGVVR